MTRRLKAYMVRHGLQDVQDAFFLQEAPQLLRPEDVVELIGVVKGHSPHLIVLDTLARCFVSGDENDAGEVGQFIDGCRQLQVETGATVLVLHHTAKKGKEERGSGALRAAADVMLYQRRTGTSVEIVNDKQKDDERSGTIRLQTQEVQFPGADGTPERSLVVVTPATSLHIAEGQTPIPANASQQLALETLRGLAEATSGDWRAAIEKKKGEPVSPKTFDNWRSALLDAGLVELVPGTNLYRPVDQATSNGAPMKGNAA